MAARLVTLKGVAEWAKVFPENRDHDGYEGAFREHDGACTIDLIMDDDNLNRVLSAGCARKPKPDPMGRGSKIRFERKFDTGQDWNSGPPVVVKDDGTPWSLQEDGLIGNGSTVQVSVTVFDTQRKICGTRLDKVVVLDHVQYNQPEAIGETPLPVQKPVAAPVKEDAILF